MLAIKLIFIHSGNFSLSLGQYFFDYLDDINVAPPTTIIVVDITIQLNPNYIT